MNATSSSGTVATPSRPAMRAGRSAAASGLSTRVSAARSEHIAPGVVGRGSLDRVAGAGEDAHAERPRRLDQVGEEMRLADAGLALEPDQAAGALGERRQVRLQARPLGDAANELTAG